MAIVFSNTLYPAGTVAIATVSGPVVTVAEPSDSDTFLDGTVEVVGDTATFTVEGGAVVLTATFLDDPNFILFQGAGGFFVFSNTVLTLGQQITFTENVLGDYVVPCFAAGTRILTRRGEVAVEELVVGDEAMALVGGGFARITWIGQRHIDCTRARRPADVWPIRVRAHAFGPGRPHRDLLLSPDHAVHVGGELFPVRYLENGITVLRAPVDAVSYFHVELERHDVVLAEGLATESYLDTGNRVDFTEVGRDPAQGAAKERTARQIWQARACAPLHVSGPQLAAVRLLLAQEAEMQGLGADVDPDLRLLVGGEEIRPTRLGEGWHFDLPEAVEGARLVSHCHVPGMTAAGSRDMRCLGVPVTRMLVDGRPVALDAPFLRAGWHAMEDGLRWTAGMANLPRLRTLTLLLAPISVRGEVLGDIAEAAA